MIKHKKLAITLSIFALLLSGAFLWKTTSTSGTTDDEQFHQEIRNALTEINFANRSNTVAVSTTTNNLANFISYRSGIQLNQANKNLLNQNEQNALDNSKRITKNQLAQILTDVAYEKLVTLSDADINSMADNLRGFYAPNMLPIFQDGRGSVRLRANGVGTMEPNSFIDRLKSIRNNQIRVNQRGENELLTDLTRSAFTNRIEGEITRRTGTLAEADANFFGGSANNDMTPMQAMLVTYAVTTDDMLMGNQAELQQKMTEFQQTISQFWGQSYPSPQSQRAYGVNGYIYSTPANILLDDAATTRILNLIQERGNL